MLGLYNKILRIDVGSKTFEQETIPEEISHRYLSRGLLLAVIL